MQKPSVPAPHFHVSRYGPPLKNPYISTASKCHTVRRAKQIRRHVVGRWRGRGLRFCCWTWIMGFVAGRLPVTRPCQAPCKRPRKMSNVFAEWRPEGLLYNIVQEKLKKAETLEELVKQRPDHPLALRAGFAQANPTQGAVYSALRRGDGRLGIVAELKRYQPVEAGEEEPAAVVDYDEDTVPILVRAVQKWDCDAALIWTDEPVYGGHLKHLEAATKGLNFPVVRADFIVHPLQIAEAALFGATGVLLIAGACLPDLETLLNTATLMGMECIVEVHTDVELSFAIEAGASIISFSNLDRRTNTMVMGTAERLRYELPDFVISMAGGGYSSAGECWDVMDHGFDALVLGRTMFNTRHGEKFVQEIRSKQRDADMFYRNFGYDPTSKPKVVDLTETHQS